MEDTTTTTTTDSTAATTNPLMLILSYLFPLSLIPLFVDKSPDIQFHAKQGTVLGVVILLINILAAVLVAVTGLGIFSLIASIIGLVLFIFAIIAIVKGFGGTLYSIPVIGGLVGKVPNV